jgi:nucleoside-diphosphate-sugar epimerase
VSAARVREANEHSGIFLTGATGLVGGLLLHRLAEACPERPVFALVRNRQAAFNNPNARPIQGDITQPGLGMPPNIFNELCGSIGAIVHCAASTRFTLPLDQSRRVNVQGTANVLDLGRRAHGLKLFLHISSTFVAGRMHGEFREKPLPDPPGWFTAYEQSKFEAEQLVLEQSDVPCVIARLSTLVGNSRTGHITQFNYFHQLLRLIPRNPFPVIPGTPSAPVDVVADDWVGEALLGILEKAPPAGSVLHLCAGPSESLRAHEVLELAFRVHRGDRPNSLAIIPSFVGLSEFEAFTAEVRRKGSEKLCRMAELLLLCLPHLEVHQRFLNGDTTALLAQSGITPARTREFLPLVMASCFHT